MKCPKCGAACPEGSSDCPSCGVIFAKLALVKEREQKQAAESVAQAEARAAEEDEKKVPYIDPWLGRKIAGGIALGWFALFGLYYYYAVRQARERALKTDIRQRPVALMRDPVTGEMKPVDVIVTPGRK